MSTTTRWTHLERADARLLRRALCWSMGEMIHTGPGGDSMVPGDTRGLGDLVSELEGKTALLSCLNGIDAPGYVAHVPEDPDGLMAGVLREYAQACPMLADHYLDRGMDAAAGFYEADEAAALAMAERVAS